MNIAYISYEYPPDTGYGGIGTYVKHAAKVMFDRGHDVSVFCGTASNDYQFNDSGVDVYRIQCNSVKNFRKCVVNHFLEIFRKIGFHVIESAEIGGDAYDIKKAYPDLPLVVKLHTPGVLITRIMNSSVAKHRKLRYVLGGLKRGRVDLGYWSKHDRNQFNDIDYLITQAADLITSPSTALIKWAESFWGIPHNKMVHLPNPYLSHKEYISNKRRKDELIICFVGKLNVLKGIKNLTLALKKILHRYSYVRVVFVGPDQSSHIEGMTMKQYIMAELSIWSSQIEFKGVVSLVSVQEVFASSDIAVIPSLWENFPYVCLEAMNAGLPVIGGNIGGIPDILGDNEYGLLVNPKRPQSIERALIKLIENPFLRKEFGIRAKNRVTTNYNEEIIGKQMEAVYQEVIKNVLCINKNTNCLNTI